MCGYPVRCILKRCCPLLHFSLCTQNVKKISPTGALNRNKMYTALRGKTRCESQYTTVPRSSHCAKRTLYVLRNVFRKHFLFPPSSYDEHRAGQLFKWQINTESSKKPNYITAPLEIFLDCGSWSIEYFQLLFFLLLQLIQELLSQMEKSAPNIFTLWSSLRLFLLFSR